MSTDEVTLSAIYKTDLSDIT